MLRACIVGTGPSGMYSAKYLLKNWPQNCGIDLIERLPTPYGLVRYGVAPDHQEVKSVQKDFAEVLADPRIRYFGNVQVSKDVSIKELRQRYDVVILASGADHDRELGLKNEHQFIRAAREFVAWYNGHPDVSKETDAYFRKKLQQSESCVIVGNGNVAIDCARVLLSSIEKLKTTDIADRALDALQASNVRHVSILGRRGHPQASFTMKELRELTKMENINFRVLREELDLGGNTEASKKEIETQRPTKRMDALLRETLQSAEKPTVTKSLTLRFLLSPSELIIDNSEHILKAMKCERTSLSGPAGRQSAQGTGQFEDIQCQMALRSVGYKAVPIDNSIPFDHKAGIIITKDGGRVENGLYAVGWVKRGPSGIIGTNIPDAHETVDCVLKDTPSFDVNQKLAFDDLSQMLKAKSVPFIDLNGYKRIEQEEEERGKAEHPPRPRVKFVSVDEMLKVARG
jgi:adrenodoxin-NADP+ reductase